MITDERYALNVFKMKERDEFKKIKTDKEKQMSPISNSQMAQMTHLEYETKYAFGQSKRPSGIRKPILPRMAALIEDLKRVVLFRHIPNVHPAALYEIA